LPRGGDMTAKSTSMPKEFYSHFKVFHELMAMKVQEILLVSSPYDAFIMEEDGSLASRIINEYSGLNLSHPPRVTRAASANEALALLPGKAYDMVITTPHLEEMDAFTLGLKIKKENSNLPVILLAHTVRGIYPLPENRDCSGIDKIFIWSGNSDLLMALVKNVEDNLNVGPDTEKAQVRVLILVEDSPVYYSSFLPLIYKEVVKQTQMVLGVGLNEEHRLLRMRSRPKILLATDFEEAMALYRRFYPYLLGIISDTRIPKGGKLSDKAGAILLSRIRDEFADLPLLLLSSESRNSDEAKRIPARFLDKNSPNLLRELHDFFLNNIGFGDFVFRTPEGEEVGRASDLRSLQAMLPHIPDASLWHHACKNHFSKWIMSRSEIALASQFRDVQACEFTDAAGMRQYIISSIQEMRRWQQKGVVAQFNANSFDAEIMDFVKIGLGSIGGKARGLAFMSALLHQNPFVHENYPGVTIRIPKTLVVSTDGFDAFVQLNDLGHLAEISASNTEVAGCFLKGDMPEWLVRDLEVFLEQARYPLSVRSSSLLEDAQFQPYAGLYETYMIPNNHPSLEQRLRHLVDAIKLVYASTYYEGPKAFSMTTANKPQEEAMAVIVQELAGQAYGDYFYPAISGVVQSHNFYPVSPMKPDEGIAHIALGMGKTVVEGEKTLRFSPKYPTMLPQFSTVEDMLKNSQSRFYALKIRDYPDELNFSHHCNLENRHVDDAAEEFPVMRLASTYVHGEHRIRDTTGISGSRVLTFAPILKYKSFPLPQLLTDFLTLARKGLGCPVEIEFSVNLNADGDGGPEFCFLQMRPMVAGEEQFEVQIEKDDIERAFCFSHQTLGNGKNEKMADIVYVKPECFKADATLQMAAEIGQINAELMKAGRPYLLAGPGRWGSSDRWLGIPVQWQNISAVGAIIELRNETLRADPSQGSHFFQNITSQQIHYITVDEGSEDFIDWSWLDALPLIRETRFLRHVRMEKPMMLKIDGRLSKCVMVKSR
jgi:Pyruvate phosphate dikinase, AMP/ATP-binding domain